MLEREPSYYYYVPFPSEKSSVILTAWTRTTAYWDINCAMSREEAQTYYAQSFSDPTTIYEAEKVSGIMLWMSVFFLGIILLC
jgi:hypothetical protein